MTLKTTYTFSVVATNSIGSGEAGVVMFTTPGEVTYEISIMKLCVVHIATYTYIYMFIHIAT